ncbi:melanoma-associated antigen 11-like [Nannospalax galili]|uniref:melanoma-associated antigen 11-like n=1 Tax=Nannospalax galili TaxID=1026970 RepID=UPI0004ED3688|nr:melanoma-associated antigen 11-like [Nannospalax galili]
MHHAQDSQRCNLPEREVLSLKGRQGTGIVPRVPIAEEAEATATAAVKVSGEGTPSSPESSQRASTPPTDFMGSISGGPSDEASGNQGEQKEEPVPPVLDVLRPKIFDLVWFLLLKFQRKELTTKAEMLERVISNPGEHYPLLFSEASECMEVIFGIDMIKLNPFVHSYVLVRSLGLTYDGMMHGTQGIPKTDLIITALFLIFIEGNRITEETFWSVFDKLGFYAGRDHFMFGEPRKLFTEDFVQEGYLEYRPIPNTDPAQHAFLWGPRAHAETTKMKVLEYFARATKRDPQSYPERYAEALRDEGERA